MGPSSPRSGYAAVQFSKSICNKSVWQPPKGNRHRAAQNNRKGLTVNQPANLLGCFVSRLSGKLNLRCLRSAVRSPKSRRHLCRRLQKRTGYLFVIPSDAPVGILIELERRSVIEWLLAIDVVELCTGRSSAIGWSGRSCWIAIGSAIEHWMRQVDLAGIPSDLKEEACEQIGHNAGIWPPIERRQVRSRPVCWPMASNRMRSTRRPIAKRAKCSWRLRLCWRRRRNGEHVYCANWTGKRFCSPT
jgi:hypothetical protein